jgi:hypothetical protein
MKEYDTVILSAQIDESKIPIGTKGVVLIVFETPARAYEVEFIDLDGKSLGTFTVTEKQITECAKGV